MWLEEVEEETWIVFSLYENCLCLPTLPVGGQGGSGPGHVRMDLFVCDVQPVCRSLQGKT